MRGVFWTLRRVVMVALAAGSIIGAATLTWVFVAGRESAQLSTAHLAAILALAILPIATLAAWVLDIRAAREHARHAPILEDNGLFERPGGIEMVEEEIEKLEEEPDTLRRGVERERQIHQPHRRRQERRPAGRRQ